MIRHELLQAGRTIAMATGKPPQYQEVGQDAWPRFVALGMRQNRSLNDDSDATAEQAATAQTNSNNVRPTVMNTRTTEQQATWWVKSISKLLTCFRRRKATGRPRSLWSGKAPWKAEQQELRLADVKVCKNDLSGADWDVVQPPKSGARLAFIRNLASTGKSASGRNRTVPAEAEAERR